METATTAAQQDSPSNSNNNNADCGTTPNGGTKRSSRNHHHQSNNLPLNKAGPELHQMAWETAMTRKPRHNQFSSNNTSVLNSPDLSDAEMRLNHLIPQHMYYSHPSYYGQSPRPPQSIKVGKSPVNQHQNNGINLNSPSSLNSSNSPSQRDINAPTTAVERQQPSYRMLSSSPSNRETVVFDDIEHYNRNCQDMTIGILDSPTTTDSAEMYSKVRMETMSPYSNQDEDYSKPMTMIPPIQIADYEGSPRRFGSMNKQQNTNLGLEPIRSGLLSTSPTPSLTLVSTRPPGFPQRVFSSKSSDKQDEKCDREKEDPVVPAFDYLYEFSETRKVLDEFFHQPDKMDNKSVEENSLYIGERLANKGNVIDEDQNYYGSRSRDHTVLSRASPAKMMDEGMRHGLAYLGSTHHLGRDLLDTEMENQIMRSSRNFTLSPETTDYDSNCGDLDSFSNDISSGIPDYGRLSMPVLEDGLSSGHASDTENSSGAYNSQQMQLGEMVSSKSRGDPHSLLNDLPKSVSPPQLFSVAEENNSADGRFQNVVEENGSLENFKEDSPSNDIQAALKDIQTTIQRTKVLPHTKESMLGQEMPTISANHSPVWVPRLSNSQESLNSDTNVKVAGQGGEDEEPDTDLETDRLLGQQRLEDPVSYHDDKNWTLRNKMNLKTSSFQSSTLRQGIGSTLLPTSPTESKADEDSDGVDASPAKGDKSPTESLKLKQAKNKTRSKEGEWHF